MHIPKHFSITDENEIFNFIEQNAFGQITSTVNNQLFASHLPFLVNRAERKIVAHLAKQNPQWKTIDGQQVLISFMGAHDYISPNWCESMHVPTWNYQAVHIYGKCYSFNEAHLLKKVVDKLTQQYESSQPEPWQGNYQETMVNAIIGLAIDIDTIECQYKLSQNHSVDNRKQIINHLNDNGSTALAQTMSAVIKSPNK